MHGVSDFSQVAITLGRNDRVFAGREFHFDIGQFAGFDRQAERLQLGQQALIECGYSVIVEARGLGAVDRHFFRLAAP